MTFDRRWDRFFLLLFLGSLGTGLIWAADNDAASTSPPPTASPLPATSQPAAESQPAEATPTLTRSQRSAKRYADYLIEMFSEHLTRGDWIARSMAVISLSRIDDPRVTEILFDVVKKERRKPIVALYAWEALHARQNKLTPEQRERWKQAGFQLDDRGYMRGEMRLTIVKLIEEDGPTSRSKHRFKKIFSQTNSMKSGDVPVIYALGDTLKKWKCSDLAQAFIRMLSDKTIKEAYRAEMVLQRLISPGTIPLTPSFYRHNAPTRNESSNYGWSRTQKAWKDWFKENEKEFRQDASKKMPRYSGLSKVMPSPQPITEANYKAWQKDLELRKFRLNQLDIQFVLDTTASMGSGMAWLKHDLAKMMVAFEQISREPRVGLTCYRDVKDDYLTKSAPLTDKANALIAYLQKQGVAGGGRDIPEAVYAGLYAAVHKQKWSESVGAKRVLVLIADAPPKRKEMDKIETLVKEAAEKGYIVTAIKVDLNDYYKRDLTDDWDPKLTSFDKIAQWGNGSSAWVDFNKSTPILNPSSPSYRFRQTGVAQPGKNNQAERILFRETLKSCLSEDYRDRVGPFVTILLEFCEQPSKEYRQTFPKVEARHRPRRKYKNPQLR